MTTRKPKCRNTAGRFVAGNQAAFGRRKAKALVVREVVPHTMESFSALLAADELDAWMASELKRLTKPGEALT